MCHIRHESIHETVYIIYIYIYIYYITDLYIIFIYLLFLWISREFYKQRKGSPKYTGSIQKDTKTGKRREGEKHPKNPNRRKPKKPYKTSPQINTSH